MSVALHCQVGLDFFEFLRETRRTSTKERNELKAIYNTEFRNRNAGLKDPNFSRVLYALRVSHKVSIHRGNVRFYSKVKALYQDQWQSHRGQQSLPVQDGGAGPWLVQAPALPESGEAGVRTRRELASLLMQKLKTAKTEFISDKNGVSITACHEFKDGRISLSVESKNEYLVQLYLENTGTDAVYFTYYTPLNWISYLSLKDVHKVTRANPLSIAPGSRYEIQVIFRTSLVGLYPATLAFEFKPDLSTSTAFHIVRFIEVECITSLGRELAPIAPYKPHSICAVTYQPQCPIVDGQQPEGLSVTHLKIEVRLDKYEIPAYMNQLMTSLKHSSFSDARRAMLESPLSKDNYSERFRLLLFLEELQMAVDMQRYNIPNNERDYATMTRDTFNKKLLVLEVPGVSENRPSVLRGDKLLVCPMEETGVKYCGYVHSVQLDKVKLGFSSKLLDRFVDGMKFSVEFTVNRLTSRVQHRAAEMVSKHRLGEVLFPTGASSLYQQTELPSLSLFDRQLERNLEQFTAVKHIVAGSSRPAPYLVFGPPGTGKTVTMVEAIKQIEKTQASCHILACAPSNSAADLLCKKIIVHMDKRKVFRMYATSRDPQCVPEELKACSNLVGDTYTFPCKEDLMEFKIIVTTLLTAGRLVTGGIPPGHFTHVFVDEAGHAVETECIVPLAGLLQAESGQVVLAGDPKQLGPILRSPLALKFGMGVSLLERLMRDFPLYQKTEGSFNNHFVTKLLRNYRSHPAILKIPNERFYDGELQVCADEIIRNSYCRWEHLPTKDFPVIFHGVVGRDEREANSPSYFNVAEVEVLMDYVKKLLETQGKKSLATISPKDIGIIAPYRKQVQKIRKALEKVEKDLKVMNMQYLKVGSVEEFQGQERKVMLVSTVRSSVKYMEIDQKFCLGFVKNEKRFNVAITRAKALLIVVGNHRVLESDPIWNEFIQYCRGQRGYDGFYHEEEEEEVVARLAALYIHIDPQAVIETAESEVQQQLEPEWRNDM
ncbi:putative helicase mov-10-B.2 [Lampris incognitus]|uniref:putative helicase mov-10-B.2 n=1 Tax=Lampris incognitus TaxID=2546036 RepID=UPI0024B5E61F|nr:putative helicase mov-10-B.2 [Lampris incognitus]